MTNTATNHDSSLKDIAKAVRQAIAAEKKAGRLSSGLRVSVRCDFFAGGQALRAEITAADFQVFTSEFSAWKADQDRDWDNIPQKFTAQALDAIQAIDNIVNPFHRQETDWQADYCWNNFFYQGAKVDGSLV